MPVRSIAAVAAIAVGLAGCAASTRPDIDRSLQVQNPKLKVQKVAPEQRLAPFDKVALAPIELEFRPVEPLAGPTGSYQGRSEFPVAEREREELVAVFNRIFREELADNARFTLTEEPGAGVLLIRPALRDIVSRVPPEEPPGRSRIYIDTVGEATLVLEFIDGTSGESFGTAMDRRSAKPAGTLGSFGALRANKVDTGREVRLLARRWARSLERRVEQLYFDAKPR